MKIELRMLADQKGFWVIITTALVFFSSCLFAQAPDTVWTKYYGGESTEFGRAVQPTTDNGYIIVGRTDSYGVGGDVYLIKTDSLGDTIWTKTFGGGAFDYGYSVQQTYDEGYIIVGSTSSSGAGQDDIYLVKTDASGNLVWDTTYGGSASDFGYSVQQTPDSGYIITGETISFGAGGYDVFLIKTDSSGIRKWTRSYGGSRDDGGHSVQATNDGGYVITGYTNSFIAGASDVYLIKTDSSGVLVWDTTYGDQYSDYGNSVCQTPDNGFVVAGLFGADDADIYLIKTDSLGTVEWSRLYGSGSYDDEGFAVQTTADSCFITVGKIGTAANDDIYLVKTDADGDLVWTKTIGGSGSEAGYSIQETADSNYIIAGHTTSFGGDNDVYLVRVEYSPDIWVVPDSYYVVLEPGQTGDEVLGIGNSGSALLNWSIVESQNSAWLSEDPTSGTTNPGSSSLINVHFDATGLSAGAYYDTLIITNNDPDEPEVRVPIHLLIQAGGIDEEAVESTSFSLTVESNPFRNTAAISFTIPANGSASRLAIYDITGRMVKIFPLPIPSGGRVPFRRESSLCGRLSSNKDGAASYLLPTSVSWNGSDNSGRRLPSGVYFVRLEIDGKYCAGQRLVFVK